MVKDIYTRVICIKTDSGLPLFVRSVGSTEQPPDPVVTSLNGIYSFCSSYGVKLIQTTAGNACISWKTFSKSLTLILVTNASKDEGFHENILNLIFKSFVLLLGSEQLQQNSNFDKLKKDLQVCYRLVDSLITLSDHHEISCVVTQTINSLSSPDHPSFQLQFEGYASSIGTKLACFFIGGLLSAATTKFMQLSSIELVLVQHLVISVTSSSSSNVLETGIYLPEFNPNKVVRLILLNVIRGTVICLLCDKTNSLPEIISKTKSYWSNRNDDQSNLNLSRGNLEFVQNFSRMTNKSLPYLKDINKDIISFLLINRSLNQNITCINVNENSEQGSERTLKAFYQTAQMFFMKLSSVENTGQDISIATKTEAKNSALAHYICLETFKCFACHDNGREIYIVFNGSIPTFALRSATKEFLSYLLSLKWFHL